MGIDVNYQALPDGCLLLEKATQNTEFGSYLGGTAYRFEQHGLDRPSDPPEFREFCALVRVIIATNPGIEARQLQDASRAWDALHYLLSEHRRRWHTFSFGDDLGSKAIGGGHDVAAHIRGGQGGPVRYLSAEHVLEVAAWLERTSPEEFRWRYSPAEMVECGVYKL
jgi:Domain of unknown function (DUF1877)